MNVLELYSGVGNVSKHARLLGHEAYSIDLYQPADLNVDVLTLSGEDILNHAGWDSVDVIWASPPCQGFSVASIGRMWEKPGVPKHPTSELGLSLLEKTLELIEELSPRVWYLENPRGMMRKMPILQDYTRHTVTYCQYGEERMKPTDIWTNNPNWTPRPACKNGDSCHVSAPRGSQTGTQGMGSAKLKGVIPDELCIEVLNAAQ